MANVYLANDLGGSNCRARVWLNLRLPEGKGIQGQEARPSVQQVGQTCTALYVQCTGSQDWRLCSNPTGPTRVVVDFASALLLTWLPRVAAPTMIGLEFSETAPKMGFG
jgi:hypothetical protein